uniref:Uncharacterized protein n=1 Tax=Arundo donax TaxID=35708 RepID=A0A0A9HIS9_ARUDO
MCKILLEYYVILNHSTIPEYTNEILFTFSRGVVIETHAC